MSTKIFVNLPVKDLPKSMAFFEALGWRFNKQFTDATAACLVVSDEINFMLLTHAKFREFTDRTIAERGAIEAIIAISAESVAEMERICDAALAAGGAEAKPPQDFGFMKYRTFLDLDGHHWEVLWMDPSYAPAQA